MTSHVRPEQGAVFDLSARAIFRVTGADRLRFLNGQISNDLRKASPEAAIYACVLTAKGKISGDAFIAVNGDSFIVDAEPGTGEALAARLERYIIADDVQIEDVTGAYALFHVLGPSVPQIDDSRAVRANRFGIVGVDLWLENSRHAAALQELSAQLPLCDEQCAEMFRLERGVPRAGRELTEEIIPTEANLESRAIDYGKGCYIGQEVISRIKMSGQTNKQLCGLVATSDTPLSPGMRLFSMQDGKEVGWITSAAMSSRLRKQIALGFVKRGSQARGVEFEARIPDEISATQPGRVQIVPLPFI